MDPQKHEISPEDFRCLFEALPAMYIVVDREFRIVAITNFALGGKGRRREDVVGAFISDAFPDNPDANGTEVLGAALQRVLDERAGHILPVQRFDIEVAGTYEDRHFKPLNWPVFNTMGEVEYVIHGVDDVTEPVRQSQAI